MNGVVSSIRIAIIGLPKSVKILVASKPFRSDTIIKINKKGVASFKKVEIFVVLSFIEIKNVITRIRAADNIKNLPADENGAIRFATPENNKEKLKKLYKFLSTTIISL